MNTINATEARKEWSLVVDQTIREKPQFIKRTRDRMILADVKFIQNLLSAYSFTAMLQRETDGSCTLSLNEIDLIENDQTEEAAKLKLAQAIIDYSEDFYNDFEYWSTAPNRINHIPFVFKALILSDVKKVGGADQMPKWKDLKRFCENDNWEMYKDTDHYYFRKRDHDNSIRMTKISKGSGEIKQKLWQEILKKQLKVSKDYFNKMI